MARKKQALDAKRGNIFLVDPDDLYMETDPSKAYYDSRVHHTYEEHVVRGMLKHGVKETTLATKLGDRVILLDGRQRVINAREAKRRQLKDGMDPRDTIRVRVQIERGNEAVLEEVGMIGNLHRRRMNPVTEAEYIAKYLGQGHTEEQAAEFCGFTVKTVQNRLRLLELCPEVRQAITEEQVPASTAMKWSNLPVEEQWKRLDAILNPKPKAKKPRIRRPGKKKVSAVLESNGSVPEPVRAAIRWIQGEITDEEACEKIKGLGKVLAKAMTKA